MLDLSFKSGRANATLVGMVVGQFLSLESNDVGHGLLGTERVISTTRVLVGEERQNVLRFPLVGGGGSDIILWADLN